MAKCNQLTSLCLLKGFKAIKAAVVSVLKVVKGCDLLLYESFILSRDISSCQQRPWVLYPI